MNEEELLGLVGRSLADQPAGAELLEDPRWERLAAGDLDDADRAELRRLAEEAHGDAALFEALQPLDEAAHGRMEALFGGAEAVEPEAAEPDSAEEAGAQVVAFPHKRRWPPFLLALPVLAAAAGILLMLRPATYAPLPVYSLELEGGEQRVRSGGPAPAGGVAELTPETLVTLLLRPAEQVTGEVRLLAWLVRAGEGGEAAVVPIDLPARPHDGGTLVVEGTAGGLFGARQGDWTLALLVAREADPTPEAAAVVQRVAHPPAVLGSRWFAERLRFVPR